MRPSTRASDSGRPLVSGLANADNYKVREGRIVDKLVSAQKLGVYASRAAGTQQQEVEAWLQEAQTLTDEQILRLDDVGRTIEDHFGRPQHIEWCLADDTFFIVQSRPITTMFPVPGVQDGKNHVYMSFSYQ